MAEIVTTVRPSYRDVAGKFVKADEQLIADKRDMARRIGQDWVKKMREEAPKKSGEFAKGIRFRTTVAGEQINMSGTIPQPLGEFIIEGTQEHDVSARNANALAFFWPKIGKMVFVPKIPGPTYETDDFLVIGKGFVTIPKRDPNKFNERALVKWKPFAFSELARISVNWTANSTR